MNPRYKPVDCLKSNGEMEIWKVQDEVSLQPVLAKRLRLPASEVMAHQFRMEETVLSSLDSPYIPRLLDLESSPTETILYETWMEGEQLDVWLSRKPGYFRRITVFRQLVALLELVHREGFLYLDLKPDNVLVASNHACLIDFNACIYTGSFQALYSNPDAMPPEYASQPLDERADQIGLGRLHQRMFGVSSISWRCLQQDPARRYPSLQVLLCPAGSFAIWAAAFSGVIMLSFILCFGLPAAGKTSRPKPGSFQTWLQQKDAASQLYLLMESGSLDPQIVQDEESARMLMKWTLDQGYGVLAMAVLNHLPKEVLEANALTALRLKSLAGLELDEQEILAQLETAAADGGTSSAASDLCCLIAAENICLDHKAFMNLVQLCAAVTDWTPAEAELVFACWIQSDYHPQIPSGLRRALESSDQGSRMLELYESLSSREIETDFLG